MPDNLTVAGGRRHGDIAPQLPAVNIRDVNFDFGDENALQRVMNGIAVMGVSARVDHDADQIFFIIGLLQAVDDSALVIALEAFGLNPQLLRLLTDHFDQ